MTDKTGGSNPTEAEIKEQLHRILESETFSGATARMDILEGIVELFLAKQTITQGALAAKVATSVNTMHQNVANTRKSIEKYYRTEGKADLILISLPKTTNEYGRVGRTEGEYYNPEVSYNPNHSAALTFRTIIKLINSDSRIDILRALIATQYLLYDNPDNPDVRLAYAAANLAEVAYNPQLSGPVRIDFPLNHFPLHRKDYDDPIVRSDIDRLAIAERELAFVADIDDHHVDEYVLAYSYLLMAQTYVIKGRGRFIHLLTFAAYEILPSLVENTTIYQLSRFYKGDITDKEVSKFAWSVVERGDSLSNDIDVVSLLLAVSDFAGAERLLSELLLRKPNYPLALSYLYLYYWLTQRYEAALELSNGRLGTSGQEETIDWLTKHHPPKPPL